MDRQCLLVEIYQPYFAVIIVETLSSVLKIDTEMPDILYSENYWEKH